MIDTGLPRPILLYPVDLVALATVTTRVALVRDNPGGCTTTQKHFIQLWILPYLRSPSYKIFLERNLNAAG